MREGMCPTEPKTSLRAKSLSGDTARVARKREAICEKEWAEKGRPEVLKLHTRVCPLV